MRTISKDAMYLLPDGCATCGSESMRLLTSGRSAANRLGGSLIVAEPGNTIYEPLLAEAKAAKISAPALLINGVWFTDSLQVDGLGK